MMVHRSRRFRCLARHAACLLGTLIASLPLTSALADDGPAESQQAQEQFFEQRIRPLFVEHCFECHGGTRAEGGLRLDTAQGLSAGGDSGPVVVAGQPESSELLKRLRSTGDDRMPPEGEGDPVPQDQAEFLSQWITQGAVDPRQDTRHIAGMTREQADSWWAFQPLPQSQPTLNPTTLDALIAQRAQQEQLPLAKPADKRTLIRRATYDLTGLPPTPEQVAAFLADDSPDAFARVVDRLLASPEYGVQWGRHWLDVVRYADTAGENTDRPLPHAWRYRNWVFDSINQDLPYDEFVRLQLAGDLLRADSAGEAYREGLVATGYLAIARRFGHDIDKDIHLMYEDVIDNLGKSFLGLTTSCARCHDHKYDPITMADYYALYGVFDSTKFSFPGCEPEGQPRDLIPLLKPQEVEEARGPWEAEIARLTQQREQLQAELAGHEATLRTAVESNATLLAESLVAEGERVTLSQAAGDKPVTVTVAPGDVICLTVLPRESHGADSTQIELQVTQVQGEQQSWSTRDLLDDFLTGNPMAEGRWSLIYGEPTWHLLDESLDGIPESPVFQVWRHGGVPSALVNPTEDAIQAWTTIPPRSLLIHPGPDDSVAIAWTSPIAGEVSLEGWVQDAHPADGHDGVAFRLERVAAAGPGLAALAPLAAELSRLATEPPPPLIPVAFGAVDREPRSARIQRQGNPELAGDEVERRWLEVFGANELGNAQSSGRLELAQKIIDQPVTARVLANRLWQWHFGNGIVATPNDFGTRGRAPDHPELLDALASQLVAHDWQLKPMHRLIMATEAYQRASSLDPNNLAADSPVETPALLPSWCRYPRRRLQAEELRDSLLTAGGNLDVSPAQAHPFPPESTWTFTQHQPFNAVYETTRRSAYLMVQRQRRHPFLALFDGADPNSSTAVRSQTTVPSQALYFLNDPFFHQQSQLVAQRLDHNDSPQQTLTQLFHIVYQRDPTSEEQQAATEFLLRYPGDDQQRWAAYARVLMAANEFLYLD